MELSTGYVNKKATRHGVYIYVSVLDIAPGVFTLSWPCDFQLDSISSLKFYPTKVF